MKPMDAAEVSSLVEKLKRGELTPSEFMREAAPDLDEDQKKKTDDAARLTSVGDERAGKALRKIRSL